MNPTNESIGRAFLSWCSDADSGFIRMIERIMRDARELDRQAPGDGWTLRFSDERDFCLMASQLIGAAYSSGQDAAKRLNDMPVRANIFGAVSAHAAAPHPPAQEKGEAHSDLVRRMKEANQHLIGSAADHRAIADGIEAIQALTRAAGAEDARDAAKEEAYDKIDHFLRNVLMDSEYAEYSDALEIACGYAGAAIASQAQEGEK